MTFPRTPRDAPAGSRSPDTSSKVWHPLI
jgi:hypothetical protein